MTGNPAIRIDGIVITLVTRPYAAAISVQDQHGAQQLSQMARCQERTQTSIRGRTTEILATTLTTAQVEPASDAGSGVNATKKNPTYLVAARRVETPGRCVTGGTGSSVGQPRTMRCAGR